MKNPGLKFSVAGLLLSAAAFVGLVLDEGHSEKAIIPTKGDVPTVGFGTTTRPDGSPVQMGDTITPTQSVERAFRDVTKFEGIVKSCITVPLSQVEYDIYVALAYNIGGGKAGVSDGFCYLKRGGLSTLARRLNAGDYKGACEAILLWKRVGAQDCSVPGNKVCAGLWKRRLAAYERCIGENG